MKKQKLATAAILTIKDPANLSSTGKKRIIGWMHRQINFLSRYNKKLGKNFRARYIYAEGK